MTYRFEHDPESGAFYIRVRDGEYHETIPLGEPGFGAGVDVDAEGNVLGFEFLSFEEFQQVVAEAGGHKEIPDRLRLSATPSGSSVPESAREAVEALDPRERKALLLQREGHTGTEVAERLGVTLEEVYRLQFAASTKLREALERRGTGSVDDAALEAFLSKL
jgi:uncharacterized protein YuzE